MGQRTDEAVFWSGVAAAAGLLIVLAFPVLLGRVYTLDDLGNFHLPLRWFYARCLAHGWDFTWIPSLRCGYYLHGEGQAGLYHPLHLLLYRCLPLSTAFGLELLLGYPCMLAGTYVLLRRWKLGRAAAMFGGAAFTFSGFNLLHFVHVNAVAVVAHLPWLLVAVAAAMDDPDRHKASAARVGIVLILASQLLLGYPQYVWMSLLAVGLYGLCMVRRAGARRLGAAALAAGFGLAAGAVQLLPTWTALRDSLRGDTGPAARVLGSLHPGNLLQLVAPYAFEGRFIPQRTAEYGLVGNTHEFGIYAGMAALVLAVMIMSRPAAARTRRVPVLTGAVLVGVGAVLAMGGYTPVYRLVAALPVAGLFRFPARYIVLVHLGVAVLAAAGMDDILRGDRGRKTSAWRLAPVPLASLAFALFALILVLRGGGASVTLFGRALHAGPRLLLGAALAVGDWALARGAAGGRRAFAGALVVFAVMDQGAYGLSYIRREPPSTVEAFRDGYPAPPDPGPCRVAARTFRDNVWLMRGYRLLGGYVALPQRWYLDYRKIAALRVAGVRWRRAPAGAGWEEVPDPLPRARLVTRSVRTRFPDRDIDTVDVAATALVCDRLPLDGGAPGKVTVCDDTPGKLHCHVRAASRQLLVVSESWHRGWKAFVNGEPAPVLRAYGDFMGCVVGPETREVTFVFDPADLRAGAGLSAGALLLVLGGCLFACLRPRRARVSACPGASAAQG